eukprot:325593-Chlamydomonas_euryale.AAC.1
MSTRNEGFEDFPSPHPTPPQQQQHGLLTCAISGTSGSSGLASVSSDEIDSSTLEMVSAGDHWSLRMSRQMEPCAFTFGW